MIAFDTGKLWPPFSDPVAHSQHAFRLILKAMSEPGERVSFDALLDHPLSHSDVAGASFIAALTLLDHDTKVWLSPAMDHPIFVDNLRFHCGCPLVSSAGLADFVFMLVDEWTSLAAFKQGSDENPHHSATLIVQTEQQPADGSVKFEDISLYAERNTLILSGPGIRNKRKVVLPGIKDRHVRMLRENYQAFPLGQDILLTFGNQLMALPRSTRIDAAEDSAGAPLALEDVS